MQAVHVSHGAGQAQATPEAAAPGWRWQLVLALLLGEPVPPVPALPGRQCCGLVDPNHGRDRGRQAASSAPTLTPQGGGAASAAASVVGGSD